MIIRI